MNVRRISMLNCYSHALSQVEIPDHGIVVVVGSNGSGKSGLFLEGVALGLFGKTLRGAPGWHPDATESMIAVNLAGLHVERLRARGKTTLHWTAQDDGTEEGKVFDALARLGGLKDPTSYETTTKAQDALEAIIGSFDVWRRTSAFSSSDAAHFSLATDAERKRLLESVLGIDRFDIGLDRCRADLKAAVADAHRIEVEAAKVRAIVDACRSRVDQARADIERFSGDAPPEPVPLTGRSSRELTAILERTQLVVRTAGEKLTKLENAGSHSQGEAYALADLGRRLSRSTTCPTCAQAISPDHLVAVRAGSARAAEVAAAAREQVTTLVEAARAEFAEATEERDAIRVATERVRAAEAAHKSATAERDRYLRMQASMEKALAEAELAETRAADACENAECDAATAKTEVATLEAVDQVLGIRGVRANLLGRALAGIEAVGNAWLGRLGLPGLAVRLKASKENKTGGVVDAISLEVEGAGRGHGYKAASGGERRRIDLAMLLGLAEVAAASHGQNPGTLFFDELFESLDVDGVDCVTRVLSELAQNRAVVVITHNDALARALPAVRRFTVDGGTVT